jgi:hypothetical protein
MNLHVKPDVYAIQSYSTKITRPHYKDELINAV